MMTIVEFELSPVGGVAAAQADVNIVIKFTKIKHRSPGACAGPFGGGILDEIVKDRQGCVNGWVNHHRAEVLGRLSIAAIYEKQRIAGDIVIDIRCGNVPADHIGGPGGAGGNNNAVYVVAGRSIIVQSIIKHLYVGLRTKIDAKEKLYPGDRLERFCYLGGDNQVLCVGRL